MATRQAHKVALGSVMPGGWRRFGIYLTPETAMEVRKEARRTGESFSVTLRTLIDVGLETLEQDRKEQAYEARNGISLRADADGRRRPGAR